MQKISDALKSNRTYIRTCIQYEVLGKKPAWDAYMSFCEKLGDNVMEFVEFEFWYFKFYNGELDLDVELDYEKYNHPKYRTIMDLPAELFGQVGKDFKPVDRILLRQVSTGMQSMVDNLETTMSKWLEFTLGNSSVSLMSVPLGPTKHKNPNNTLTTIAYDPLPKKGYTMKYDGITRNYKMGTYLDGARQAFSAFFHSSNTTVDDLRIRIYSKKDGGWKKMINGIPKSEESMMKVKSFDFEAQNCSENGPTLVLPLLKSVEPGVLETIKVSSRCGQLDCDKVAVLAQWKLAKSADLSSCGSLKQDQLRHFIHFEKFSISIYRMKMETLVSLRNDLQKAENFKQCTIEGSHNISAKKFATEIGAVVEDKLCVWDPIPGSTDFLKFRLNQCSIVVQRCEKN